MRAWEKNVLPNVGSLKPYGCWWVGCAKRVCREPFKGQCGVGEGASPQGSPAAAAHWRTGTALTPAGLDTARSRAAAQSLGDLTSLGPEPWPFTTVVKAWFLFLCFVLHTFVISWVVISILVLLKRRWFFLQQMVMPTGKRIKLNPFLILHRKIKINPRQKHKN